MKRGVKIQFSQEELGCMSDTDFLLRKRIITAKLYDILHELIKVLKTSPVHMNFKFPVGADYQTGKISKGENYKGLPYLILDFPRLFERENIFAFRTIFWWGNYFSFTLHLKGEPLEQFRNSILDNYRKRKEQDILIYTGHNEWDHDLTMQQYVAISSVSHKIIREMEFVKLSRKADLKDYGQLLKKGKETYESFLKVLTG